MPRPLPQKRLLRPALLIAGLLAMTALLSAAAFALAQYTASARLEAELRDRLTVTRHSVVTEIERFRYLPAVVGQDARVRALLAHPGNAAAVDAANAYLQTVRDLSGVDELYVTDAQGLTVAASNWNQPGSFLGHSYAFRPYFQGAMQDGAARYYAVGVTTGKPGYFLSARLGPASAPTGVAVVKVDMATLEGTWVRANEHVALADPDGVIFLSGPRNWKYRPLQPLAAPALERMLAERRYDGLDITAAVPLTGAITSDTREPLRIARAALEPDGWQIVVGLPSAPVLRSAWQVAGLAALAGLLASVGALIFWQRRQLIRLKLNQNVVLERRVAERTAELAHEIEERRRAEDELRQTHESLVHAAKLAVLGRMSAAIVHEVSQPLSALDNTLAAAELHLSRGDTGRVGNSLGSARGLLRRMQTMVRHLKTFGAKQKLTPPEPVDMAAVLAASAEILEPRLRELGVGLALPAPASLPPVSGNAVRLEQVATNLLLNAAEASAGAGPVTITAALDLHAPGLRLTIADRGPGIPEDMRERIMEPFFTTRVTGEGLGLGLSIVRTILEQTGGTLTFAPRPGGGTLTLVDLPLHQASASKAAR
ncbi:ATP-binding protein [Frigidibacter mobilis]|uniref:histidine kinase n=1 Tax=Frigidibacter mobilis TaxID=1335048 RepID=A0A159Z7C6_9RHOB|nr:ATP-binding protein [Frigidibacter mobilis]AMY70414.1 integral membrane sensor signal transduction histidine kinase [Frigidibacter mobilis]